MSTRQRSIKTMLYITPFALLASGIAQADGKAPPTLRGIQAPHVEGLDQIVTDKQRAIELGKALFWDIQTGSDGAACASCHFHAGADSRAKNQLGPGLLHARQPDSEFDITASGNVGGPNYTLLPSDFPFHQFHDPDNRSSGVKFRTNDVVSSQGVFNSQFVGIGPANSPDDDCDLTVDPIFHVNNTNTRRVEPRNSPTTINAVFNFRNFWDGRANNIFNGVDPFGLRNEGARVLVTDSNGQLSTTRVSLPNASLASQASGPPLSDFEMSCAERRFAHLGRKLVDREPLAFQQVHAEDSVLDSLVDDDGHGLKDSYRDMIEKAFASEYWQGQGSVNGYTQIESNFSLFFSLAVQLYEATLISDRSRYDRFAEGQSEDFDPNTGDQDRLTASQRRGLDIFVGRGSCVNCHKGPDFTGAGFVLQKEAEEGGLVERMDMGNGETALYDNGFYNIGVTRTAEDLGVGETDPFGNPLSFSRQFKRDRFVDDFEVNPCKFEVPFDADDCEIVPDSLREENVAVRGAFKTPGLRNVELTGPYMHNGSMATLLQVVEFYNRGGNFSNNRQRDPDIRPLGLNEQDKKDLVNFMRALTDPRVRNERAPFDHPELPVPNGHIGDQFSVVDADGNLRADDDVVIIPAVGKRGRKVENLPPLKPFLQIDFREQHTPN